MIFVVISLNLKQEILDEQKINYLPYHIFNRIICLI